MRIQHNIAALNSYKNLTSNNGTVSKNLEKLSSGYRINRAGDDAAGLAISEKMRAQITGLETASKNANDGISLVQTAEGALTEVHSMLNRMVELAQQSANGTYQDAVDRDNLQKEMDSLTSEIDRISAGTNFNGITLLNGELDGQLKSKNNVDATAAAAANAEAFSYTVSGDDTTDKGVTVKFVTADGSAATDNSVTAALSGKQITITMTQKEAGTVSQKDIDAAIKTAYDADKANWDALGTVKVQLSDDIKFTGASAAAADLSTSKALAKPGNAMTLQIGESSDKHNQLAVNISSMSIEGLGLTDVKVNTQEAAAAAVKTIKTAINTVSSTRGDLGALQNRLEHTINNLSVTTENMTAAESRIRDVDMAKEMMSYTKNNILVQASQAMLAQANQVPQGVLQLLK